MSSYTLQPPQLQCPDLLGVIPYFENIQNDQERFAAEVAVVREAYRCAKVNEENFDKLFQYVTEDVRAYKAAGYSYEAFQDLFRDEITFQKAYRSDKERKAKSLHAVNHGWRHEPEALAWVDGLPESLKESRSFLDALKAFAKCVWSWDEAKDRINYQIRKRLVQRGRGIRLDKEITTSDLRAARNGVLGMGGGKEEEALLLRFEDIDLDWLAANGLEVNRFGIIDFKPCSDNPDPRAEMLILEEPRPQDFFPTPPLLETVSSADVEAYKPEARNFYRITHQAQGECSIFSEEVSFANDETSSESSTAFVDSISNDISDKVSEISCSIQDTEAINCMNDQDRHSPCDFSREANSLAPSPLAPAAVANRHPCGCSKSMPESWLSITQHSERRSLQDSLALVESYQNWGSNTEGTLCYMHLRGVAKGVGVKYYQLSYQELLARFHEVVCQHDVFAYLLNHRKILSLLDKEYLVEVFSAP